MRRDKVMERNTVKDGKRQRVGKTQREERDREFERHTLDGKRRETE